MVGGRVNLFNRTDNSWAYGGEKLPMTEELLEMARSFDCRGVAITDYYSTDAWEEAYNLKGKYPDVKCAYGATVQLVDDSIDVVINSQKIKPCSRYVVIDVETTGFNRKEDGIIEISAIRFDREREYESFSTFVNPGKSVPQWVIDLTGITDDQLMLSPTPQKAVENLFDFIKDDVIVVHNRQYVYEFLAEVDTRIWDYPSVELIHSVFLTNRQCEGVQLKDICYAYGFHYDNDGTLLDDCFYVCKVFQIILDELKCQRISDFEQLNAKYADKWIKRPRPNSAPVTILVQNEVGLSNFMKVLSDSDVSEYDEYGMYIKKSDLQRYRSGMLVSNHYVRGDLFYEVLNGESVLKRNAQFYDYLVVMRPTDVFNLGYYQILKRKPGVEELRIINQEIIKLGYELKKPVVAVADLMADKDELLKEFDNPYISSKSLVVDNPQRIFDSCSLDKPFIQILL